MDVTKDDLQVKLWCEYSYLRFMVTGHKHVDPSALVIYVSAAENYSAICHLFLLGSSSRVCACGSLVIYMTSELTQNSPLCIVIRITFAGSKVNLFPHM